MTPWLQDALVEIYWTPRWQIFVAIGSVELLLGFAVWAVACLRLAWAGHPLPALGLGIGGVVLSAGVVLGGIYLDLTEPWRWSIRGVFGVQFDGPDLLLLPDDAVQWVFFAFGLAIIGLGIALIRPGGHRFADEP